MLRDGNLEYALARVHARHGGRPRESEWRRLEASRDLPHYLDALRSSSLAPWCSSFDTTTDGHALERGLRASWRGYVNAVAWWHPRAWQPWLGWLAWLSTLSLLAQLARAESAPAWLLADPVCGPLAPGDLERRRRAIEQTPLRPLAAGIGGGQPLGKLWWLHWQELAPAMPADVRALLESVIRQFGHLINTLAAADSSVAARAELTAALSRAFRAGATSAIASLCHLSLVALDLERLRGGLISRRLFTASTQEPA